MSRGADADDFGELPPAAKVEEQASEQDTGHDDAQAKDQIDPPEPEFDEPPNPSAADDPGPKRLTRPQVVGLMVLLGLAALVSALLWWRDEPQTPIEELGLGSARPEESASGASSAEIDPEQSAFLERQRERASELTGESTEAVETQRGITLTDRDLIHRLAGRWRLDLGGRHVMAEFAPVVVDRARRGSLLVELYPVDSRHLPPFYTVFELPGKGTFIAFRAADGTYRLVLESVRFHDSDHFSFHLGPGGRRLQAFRLQGPRPEDLELQEHEHRGAESPWGSQGERDRRSSTDANESDSTPEVRIIREPPAPASEMWKKAEKLRDQDRLHSLSQQLQKILNVYPRHRQARRWHRRIDDWIQDQRRDMIDDLRDELEDLADAVRDHDLDEIFEGWDERPDPATRRFFSELLGRHREMDARITLHSVEIEDGVAEFSATVTLEGWTGRQRNREIIPHRWRGQFQDGHFTAPFR